MNENQKHWNELGTNYSKVWESKARIKLSNMELNFIMQFLKDKEIVLDIGIGTGRLLNKYIQSKNVEKIYGLDISSEMIKICKQKFQKKQKVKFFYLKDIAKKKIILKEKVTFISAIRVFKYSKTWENAIQNCLHNLKKEGTLIFDIPNKYSINCMGSYKIPFYKSSIKELKKILKAEKVEILAMKSFSRLPDITYSLYNNETYAKTIINLDKLLNKICGDVFLGKSIFIAVRKLK